MRCNNCGFENAPDAHHCVKCNMLLDGAETKRAERATPPSRQEPPAERKETFFAGTIADSPPPTDRGAAYQPADHGAVPPSSSQPTLRDEAASAPLISCPHPDCGYPYSSELKACPRCQRPADAASYAADAGKSAATAKPATAKPATEPNASAAAKQAAAAKLTAETMPAAPAKPNPIKGTIDPYRIKAAPEPPPPSCWLLPVTKAGEKPAEAPGPVALSFTPPSIDLNRDTLEPGNTSITGKVQAQLTFKDGAWQLKDQSELQTTFLQVSTETTLKEGDIILFGDRKFIFSRSNPQD